MANECTPSFFLIFFSPYLGVWRPRAGITRGLGHNLLMQFLTLYSSHLVYPKWSFFAIVTSQKYAM